MSQTSVRPAECSARPQIIGKAALAGDETSVLAVLQGLRQYLLLIAESELTADLRAKVGASDLVQESLLEAYRDCHQFQGSSAEELQSWLRRILLNNVATLRRRFRQTEKRHVGRERPIDSIAPVIDRGTSPSRIAMRNEQAERVARLLERLPEHHQTVLRLRHWEHLSFSEIGQRMGRSTDAARMLWWRAFERLAELAERSDAVRFES